MDSGVRRKDGWGENVIPAGMDSGVRRKDGWGENVIPAGMDSGVRRKDGWGENVIPAGVDSGVRHPCAHILHQPSFRPRIQYGVTCLVIPAPYPVRGDGPRRSGPVSSTG